MEPAISALYKDVRVTVSRSLADAEPRWRDAEHKLTLYGFQTFDWVSAWFSTIGAKEGVEPVIVYVALSDETVVMLLPLGIRRSPWLDYLTFLGGEVTDYHAPLICPEFATRLNPSSFRELWSKIVVALPRVDVLLLERLPQVIEAAPNPLVWLPGTKRRTESHAARLSSSIEVFLNDRSPKVLADSRRQRRRLAQMGAVEFTIAAASDDVHEIMRALIRQKARRYAETGVANMWDKPGYLAFYEGISVNHTATLIQTAALRVGGNIVATHLGMVFRNRFYYMMPAYEGGDWAKYSAGRLLMEELIGWSIAHGLTVFDLTVGNEPYKRDWANEVMTVYDCLFPVSFKGKIHALYQELAPRARYYLRRLIQELKRVGQTRGKQT